MSLPEIGDRFQVEVMSSAGGMGEIYRGRDRASGEVVAIKVMRQRGEELRARFAREARMLSELRHDGIVRYLAHGTTGADEPYLVMEWLEGEDLRARLARGPLSVEESLTVAARVAGALDAMQRVGVVHRDVKPANLFLEGGDAARVKVLDLGIARSVQAGEPALTATGGMMGTPRYMAPEQVRGEPDLDGRVDVYALGCVLFECLAGRPAFDGEHAFGVLAKVLLEEPPRLRELRADVPRGLDELVARMLAKPRDARPVDARAVAGALAALTAVGDATPLPPARSALSRGEQRVISVLMAGGVTGETLPSVSLLREALATQGRHLEVLADQCLLMSFTGQGTAGDQAVLAARAALTIRQLVHMPMVVATGRAEVTARLPVGEVIDRAARGLAGAAGGTIVLDEPTTHLLEGRFAIDGALLVAELAAGEGARTLLGRPTPCVGRERELTFLEGYLEESATEPMAMAVLVTGPAGAGKSRLCQELLGRARHLVPWRARATPAAAPPFGLVGQLVRGAAGSEGLRACVTRLAAPGDVERLIAFLGELAGMRVADGPLLRAAREDAALFAGELRRAWLDFVRAACAARPVLIVIDDLQWGDAQSVGLLDATLAELHDLPLVLLAMARPELDEAFPHLWRERRRHEIRLAELARRACERLITTALGEALTPEARAGLVARCGGNAFYLEELIRAVADGRGDSLPDTILGTAQARLERLDTEARRLLRAASIFGERFEREGVLALLGDGGGAAPFDALTAGEVIAPQGAGRFAFRHALVREAAYAMLTDADRALGHRLAGEWLEPRADRDALVLADHFERAGDRERAVVWLAHAGTRALELMAFGDALGRFEHALRIAETLAPAGSRVAELLLRVGEAQIGGNDAARGKASCLRAAEIARGLGDGALFARAVLVSLIEFTAVMSPAHEIALLREALVRVPAGEEALRARLQARLASGLIPGAQEVALGLVHEAVAGARRLGDAATLLEVLYAGSMAATHADYYPSGSSSAAFHGELCHLARAAGRPLLAAHALALLVSDHLRVGDADAADESLAAFARLAAEFRQPRHRNRLPAMRAVRATMSGRFDDAEQHLEELRSSDIDDRSRTAVAVRALLINRFALLRARGDLDRLLEVGPALVAELAAHGRMVGCVLYAELGRREETRVELDRFLATPPAQINASKSMAAEAAMVIGDRALAETAYQDLAPLARLVITWGPIAMPCEGSHARVLGMLAAFLGRPDDAAAHFEIALEVNARMKALPWLARTQSEYARLLRDRDPARATALVEQALAICGSLGMRGMAARIAAAAHVT